jgi:hypothetical protein
VFEYCATCTPCWCQERGRLVFNRNHDSTTHTHGARPCPTSGSILWTPPPTSIALSTLSKSTSIWNAVTTSTWTSPAEVMAARKASRDSPFGPPASAAAWRRPRQIREYRGRGTLSRPSALHIRTFELVRISSPAPTKRIASAPHPPIVLKRNAGQLRCYRYRYQDTKTELWRRKREELNARCDGRQQCHSMRSSRPTFTRASTGRPIEAAMFYRIKQESRKTEHQ